MSEQQATAAQFPNGWALADFDPNEHMLNLKGKDYLGVQHRLLWFLQEQRAFIARGMAKMPYAVNTELVEMDRGIGFAHFKTTVRDVLGNEATAYGSETAKDFPDYAEKAGTKSLGRALVMLGYGTAQALEMDEGERVVDSPVERRQPTARPAAAPKPAPAAQQASRQPQRPDPETPDFTFTSEDNSAPPAGTPSMHDVFERAKKLGVLGPSWSELRENCGNDPAKIALALNSIEAQRRHARAS